MTSIDLIGWAAAGLALLAGTSYVGRLLRVACLGASMTFITYAAASSTWLVLALHAVLLLVNLFGLMDLRGDRPRSGDRGGQAGAVIAFASGRSPATRSVPWRRLVLMALVVVPAAAPMAAPPTYAERMHARAVESFRQGRFPEAYGRFIDLANAGHPASARYALWMCEQGLALFGKDWDCVPHEVKDWARAAGVPLPQIAMHQYMTPTGSPQSLRR